MVTEDNLDTEVFVFCNTKVHFLEFVIIMFFCLVTFFYGYRRLADKVSSKNKVKWAISTDKSPGGHGIFPTLLQQGLDARPFYFHFNDLV